MKVTALVVWSTSVEIDVSDADLAVLSKDNREDLIRDKLLNAAGDRLVVDFTRIRPGIQECSSPELED